MTSKRSPPAHDQTSNSPRAQTSTGGHAKPAQDHTLHDRIAKRAYEIYERRISQGALDDWLQAEREIRGQKKTWNPDMPHRGGYGAQEQE